MRRARPSARGRLYSRDTGERAQETDGMHTGVIVEEEDEEEEDEERQRMEET